MSQKLEDIKTQLYAKLQINDAKLLLEAEISPWDKGRIGIKKGTICVIHISKA